MKKKILQSESIPEFDEGIASMSQESKDRVDNALEVHSVSFRVDYDDQAFEIVEKISATLEPFGLRIVHDGLPHDSFDIYYVRRIRE
jgi:hypothetical protein